MRNRNVHVQLWLNRKEADALARNAKKCGLTQSAYLRHLITGFVPKELPSPDYHAMMRQHVLNVIDVQVYDRNAAMAIQAILDITKAVVEPRKMKEEELFETSTISEDRVM